MVGAIFGRPLGHLPRLVQILLTEADDHLIAQGIRDVAVEDPLFQNRLKLVQRLKKIAAKTSN